MAEDDCRITYRRTPTDACERSYSRVCLTAGLTAGGLSRFTIEPRVIATPLADGAEWSGESDATGGFVDRPPAALILSPGAFDGLRSSVHRRSSPCRARLVAETAMRTHSRRSGGGAASANAAAGLAVVNRFDLLCCCRFTFFNHSTPQSVLHGPYSISFTYPVSTEKHAHGPILAYSYRRKGGYVFICVLSVCLSLC